MKTLLYVSALSVVLIFAFWAYNVNYHTQEAARRVKDLRIQIATELEAIGVLEAEWAYLNRPDRLRRLAEMHFADLELMPMTADHFGSPSEIAFPPEPVVIAAPDQDGTRTLAENRAQDLATTETEARTEIRTDPRTGARAGDLTAAPVPGPVNDPAADQRALDDLVARAVLGAQPISAETDQ